MSLSYFLRVLRLHIFVDDLAKFARDVISLQRYRFLTVHKNRCDWAFSRSGKTDTDICVLAFPGTVDHASHYGQGHVLHAVVLLPPNQHPLANVALYAFSKLLKIS